jgi:hypothetical protein
VTFNDFRHEKNSWRDPSLGPDEEVEAPLDFSGGAFASNEVFCTNGTSEEFTMNTFERRQMIREQMIDATIAKAAINKSKRDRKLEARKLEKSLAASRAAATPKELISYSTH